MNGVRWRIARPAEDRAGDLIPANGVCVLGMHRSGTSLVAGLLRHLGVDLGPDHALLPADENNRSGYFELTELVHLNEEILEHYGGSWREPPELPPGWEDSEEIAPFRDRARDLLTQRFGGLPSWGWKDPRTCVTLPFWQRLAPGMRYVICVRDPVAVARSLRAREGEDRGLDAHARDWLRHTASAIVYTAGRPRLLVHYERYFEDTERELRRLAAFLGREDRLEDAATMRAIREFVDPALVHAPSAAAGDRPAMPSEVSALYQALNRGAPEACAGINALAARCLGRPAA